MNRFGLLMAVFALGFAAPLAAQPARPGGGDGPPRLIGNAAYPPRVTDPAAVARGRALYSDRNCVSCHAADARGTERGPSLLRSATVMNDQKGELIAPVIHNGASGMPAMPDLNADQIADIAEFLHSFPILSRDPARERPASIVTGDARRGESYFAAHCSQCHSVTGDLKGVGSKYADPRALQGALLSPPGRQNVTATVTLPGGKTVEGRLNRVDEFVVSLTTADGWQRSFTRHGASPKVILHDPLDGHKALLRRYSDQDIHDLTAYLVTVK